MADTSNSPARVAIVTGAAQGIGEAIALRLAEDGFDVAVNDIPTKAEQLATVVKALEAKGRKAIPVTGDVTNEGDVVAMIEKTVELLGGLDVVCTLRSRSGQGDWIVSPDGCQCRYLQSAFCA